MDMLNEEKAVVDRIVRVANEKISGYRQQVADAIRTTPTYTTNTSWESDIYLAGEMMKWIGEHRTSPLLSKHGIEVLGWYESLHDAAITLSVDGKHMKFCLDKNDKCKNEWMPNLAPEVAIKGECTATSAMAFATKSIRAWAECLQLANAYVSARNEARNLNYAASRERVQKALAQLELLEKI